MCLYQAKCFGLSLLSLAVLVTFGSQKVEARKPITLINGWYKTACIAENLKVRKRPSIINHSMRDVVFKATYLYLNEKNIECSSDN